MLPDVFEDIARELKTLQKRVERLERRDQTFIITTDSFELLSTTRALLVPRMTTAQRDLLAAVNGMIIYNTTTTQVEAFEAGAWGAL